MCTLDGRDRPEETTEEIEITPQMIEAGVDVSYDLVSSEGLQVCRSTLVSSVYRVMEVARLASDGS